MVTDFHTHILPHVDDGASSTAESSQMLDCIAAQGVRRVVFTPHFYANHDTPQRFFQRREKAFARLVQHRRENWPELHMGAEVHYFEGISDCDALDALTVGGTRCVLVEMPSGKWNSRMLQELEGIRKKRGITPIIAHIDRYLPRFSSKKLLDQLAQMPVLIQANADFFIQRSTRRQALKMLQSGHIHLLGSDCHNMASRKPNLDQAVEQITQKLGREPIDGILTWESRIFSGEKPDRKLLTLRRI